MLISPCDFIVDGIMMNHTIDSRQLKAFVCLAKHENFTLAAKELNLTQSAVSHSMKALEQDLGCKLIDRLGKKALLTQAGEQLYIYSQKILDQMAQARVSIENLNHWGQPRLRVVASSTICEYLLPSVLKSIKSDFPTSIINLHSRDSQDSINLLRSGKVDIAIAMKPKSETQLEFRPWFQDQLSFLVSKEHSWAQQGKVKRDEIPDQQYILYDRASFTFQMVAEYFKQQGFELDHVMELGSMVATKELVRLNLGVGIVAPWIARKEISSAEMTCLPIARKKLMRQWGFLTWNEKRLSLIEEKFIEACAAVNFLPNELMTDA
jgi:LysR family transcriptional regulator, low CO2-responsive transcriptional regulator